MSALKKPSATVGMRKGLAAPQVRSDETIGRSEDIGTHPDALPLPRPPKPIRVTLDLDQDRHDFLKTFAGGISSARVLRALLDELKADDALRDRIRLRVVG